MEHVYVADFFRVVNVAVEIDGTEIIPVGDTFKHIPNGREVEDVPIERVADGDETWPPCGGVVVVGGRCQVVGRFLYGPDEVHQGFKVCIGFQGSLEGLVNQYIDHVRVAQVFHIAHEGVGAMDGGQVAPMCARLRKQGIAHRVFHLHKPFAQIYIQQ